MRFIVLDKNLNRISDLPTAINIQWIQRFYSCGQFSIQLPDTITVTDIWHYIVCDERKNTGIILQKSYTQNVKGKFIQLSGFFMEHELSDVFITNYKPVSHLQSTAYKDYLCWRIGDMIEKCTEANDPLFTYLNRSDTNTNGFGKYTAFPIYNFEITNQDVMSAAYELSEVNETSFIYYLNFNETDNHKKIGFKQLEILESKTRNNVIFQEHQLDDLSVVYDDSNYKNCVRVLGPTINGKQIITEYKSDEVISKKEPEKWIMLDNTGLSLMKNEIDSDGLEYQTNYSESEIIEIMNNNAKAELLKYQRVVNISYKIIDFGNYKYLKDFSLGDFITVNINSLGIKETRQIIEIEEVWKNNQYILYMELGQSRQSIINKAARAANQGTVSRITKK